MNVIVLVYFRKHWQCTEYILVEQTRFVFIIQSAVGHSGLFWSHLSGNHDARCTQVQYWSHWPLLILFIHGSHDVRYTTVLFTLASFYLNYLATRMLDALRYSVDHPSIIWSHLSTTMMLDALRYSFGHPSLIWAQSHGNQNDRCSQVQCCLYWPPFSSNIWQQWC